jgi:hypothetical protein
MQPSAHDWLEMVKVVKGANSVLTAHKQQQLSSVCTLATDDKIFPEVDDSCRFYCQKVKIHTPPTLPQLDYTAP